MFANFLSVVANIFHSGLSAASKAHASGHAVPVCSAIASAVVVPLCSIAGVPWLAAVAVPAASAAIDIVLKRIEVSAPPTPTPAA